MIKISFKYQKNNETEMHYSLKQIGKWFAYRLGYSLVCEEGSLISKNEFGKGFKNYTDVLAAKMNCVNKDEKVNITSLSIEAKQSKEDYYNGFVSSADFNYVIIPKGLLGERDRYLDWVGIVEVDFYNLKIGKTEVYNLKKCLVEGVEIIKKAKRNPNSATREECQQINIIRQIAYRNTIEELSRRHGYEESEVN